MSQPYDSSYKRQLQHSCAAPLPKRITSLSKSRSTPILVSSSPRLSLTMEIPADSSVNMEATSHIEIMPKAEKRLSRKLTKRFSEPAPISKKEGKRTSIASTFSLPLFQRSSSTPEGTTSSPSPSITTSRVPSLTSTASSLPSEIAVPRSSAPPYNPLDNYIPCLDSTCGTHYLPTLLGPTFYSTQPPYNLSRKYGLCPTHASREVKDANARCKKEFERMRQNSGRKTLRMIDVEFEEYVADERRIRKEESKANESVMKHRILGPTTDQILAKGKHKVSPDSQWEWRYTPRPCTSQTCPHPHTPYSPFDARFHPWYTTVRKSGLRPLFNLCPTCARQEIDAVEKTREEKWREMHPQQWREWMEQLKRERSAEQTFWEEAQRKRAEPSGRRGEKEEDIGELVQGKGADVVREFCVIM